jgi:hypothetical protein
MSRRHKLFLASIGLLILLVTVLAFFLYSTINHPSNGVVDNSGLATVPTKKFDFTPQLVTGKTATFSYPAGMNPTNGGNVAIPILEQFVFTHSDIQSWKLAIAVLGQQSGRLAENSAYQFRKSKPDTYKESVSTFGGKEITIMTDVTAPGFSQIAFLISGDKSATVSLYGDDAFGVSDLEKTFEMVISTWKWL